VSTPVEEFIDTSEGDTDHVTGHVAFPVAVVSANVKYCGPFVTSKYCGVTGVVVLTTGGGGDVMLMTTDAVKPVFEFVATIVNADVSIYVYAAIVRTPVEEFIVTPAIVVPGDPT
jgi:hypothetical protein